MKWNIQSIYMNIFCTCFNHMYHITSFVDKIIAVWALTNFDAEAMTMPQAILGSPVILAKPRLKNVSQIR